MKLWTVVLFPTNFDTIPKVKELWKEKDESRRKNYWYGLKFIILNFILYNILALSRDEILLEIPLLVAMFV